MPRVPSYDNLTTSISNQPQVQVAAPTVKDVTNEQGRQLGQALQSAGSDIGRVALDMQQGANKVRVNDAMNRAVSARLGLQVDALQQKGRNALERESGKDLASEYDEKLGAELDALTDSLGNDAQKAEFKAQADQLRQQFRGNVTGHMVREQETFADETDEATIKTATDQGVLLYGDNAMRQQSVDAISATIDRLAMRKGWSPEVRVAKLAEAVSPMHAGIIKSMIQSGNAEAAQAYYDENSASMSLQSRASVQEPLQRAVFAQKADNEAVGIWAEVGPRSKDDAVRLFDMDKLVDERITDVALRKEVKATLRNQAQAWNAQQTELKAQHVAGVWRQVDDGLTLTQIRRSDAYLALGETDQHQFEAEFERQVAANESRALMRAQRELTLLNIDNAKRERQNAALFDSVSDPAILKPMTRAGVEALRNKGFTDTQVRQLLAKWEGLQKPGGMAAASMDEDAFKTIAYEMGLKAVYDSKASESEKATIGRVRMTVESQIAAEQKASGKPLSYDQKADIFRKVMARKVIVDSVWAPPTELSAVILDQKRIDDIVIPKKDLPDVADRLAKLRAMDKTNPAFTETQANMRALYYEGVLQGKYK